MEDIEGKGHPYTLRARYLSDIGEISIPTYLWYIQTMSIPGDLIRAEITRYLPLDELYAYRQLNRTSQQGYRDEIARRLLAGEDLIDQAIALDNIGLLNDILGVQWQVMDTLGVATLNGYPNVVGANSHPRDFVPYFRRALHHRAVRVILWMLSQVESVYLMSAYRLNNRQQGTTGMDQMTISELWSIPEVRRILIFDEAYDRLLANLTGHPRDGTSLQDQLLLYSGISAQERSLPIVEELLDLGLVPDSYRISRRYPELTNREIIPATQPELFRILNEYKTAPRQIQQYNQLITAARSLSRR